MERNALRTEIVTRAEQWRWSSLWRWLQRPEPDPKLLSLWPILRLPGWVDRVNAALTENELKTVRRSSARGAPLGDERWVESAVQRLHLQSTMPLQRRPKHL